MKKIRNAIKRKDKAMRMFCFPPGSGYRRVSIYWNGLPALLRHRERSEAISSLWRLPRGFAPRHGGLLRHPAPRHDRMGARLALAEESLLDDFRGLFPRRRA